MLLVCKNRTLGLSSYVLEIPNDAYTTLSQNLMGCSTLSQEYCKLIGRYWKIMRKQLGTLTCPIVMQSEFCLADIIVQMTVGIHSLIGIQDDSRCFTLSTPTFKISKFISFDHFYTIFHPLLNRKKSDS